MKNKKQKKRKKNQSKWTIIILKDKVILMATKKQKIQTHPDLTERILTEVGFTNFNPPSFYFCRRLAEDITFNLTINKKNLKRFKIDVLDENFLQPFDFENIHTPFAREVEKNYKEMINMLVEKKVLVQYRT